MSSSRTFTRLLTFLLIINQISALSFNQPKFCPVVSWAIHGTTALDSTRIGQNPIGMFINIENFIYVNNPQSKTVVKFKNGGTRVSTYQLMLDLSTEIFVTSDEEIYVGNDNNNNNHVYKSSRSSANPNIVMNVSSSCFGLFLDSENNLYCSLPKEHRVIKYSLDNKSNTTETVAGNGTAGNTLSMLNNPMGIFVHTNLSLYVVDNGNHRIQLFQPNQTNGTTIVGNQVLAAMILQNPISITIDANDYLYIVDRGNNRILRFGPEGLRCVIACSGSQGFGLNQLNGPSSMSFDSHGNMFVLDTYNQRIQKFALARNSSLSYNQPKICQNATWNSNGTTFANESVIGHYPHGFFIDSNDTIVATAPEKEQILVWTEGSPEPVRNLTVDLFNYTSPFVDIHGDVYFENDSQGKIHKWTKNSTTAEPVRESNVRCYSLFIDINETLYCAVYHENRIISTSLMDNSNVFVNFTKSDNSSSFSGITLWQPRGIFVDTNFDLYVASWGNNRILRFRRGDENATKIAGGGYPLGLNLSHPMDVVLGADRHIYIADYDGHRIIRTRSDGYDCIIGCYTENGRILDQLYKPHAIRFDSYGNLYVADESNHHIKKFTLMTNLCEIPTTTEYTTIHSLSTKQTTIDESTMNEQINTTSIETSQPLTTAVTMMEDPTNSPSGSQTQKVSTTITTAISTVTVNRSKEHFFQPKPCPNGTHVGSACNIPNKVCELLKPCQYGNCINNETNPLSYSCSCSSESSDIDCEPNHQLCNKNPCFNQGICNATANSTSPCICPDGWEGIYCEKMIDFCWNITCQNRGVCRPLLRNFTCECLGDSYSGQYCEVTSKKIVIYQAISTSTASVAIIFMAGVITFIVVMDILKYCFGIDPVREEREAIRREKREKKRKPVIERFVYVNAPPSSTENLTAATVNETIV